ncbi:MAG: hypothetical protein IPK85_01225 [Gemmatimonadetes bacterium]|nr:hypothetical protein [Gemmatimonadota bacterium]
MSHTPHYISQHGDVPDMNVEGYATGRDEALYEPRALWQVVDVPFTNQLGVEGPEVVLEGTEWQNGSRYDFVLTHLILSPINSCVTNDAYEVLQNVTVSVAHSASPIDVQRFSPALGQCLPIAPSPTFGDLSMGQFMPYDSSPRQVPPTVNPRTRAVLFAQPRIFDVARWQFDMPYRLVRRGVVQFGLSSLGAPNLGVNDDAEKLNITMGFDEAWSSGSAFRQQMRTSRGRLLAVNGAGTPWGSPLQAGPSLDANTNGVAWPPESQFNPRDWQRQETLRGGGDGSGWLQGFTVHLPNNNGVRGLDNLPAADGYPPDSGVSLATRLAVRAKTTNGGTNRSWWRDGAPLVLVSPTIGAGACMKLQTPIRLGSREQLRITLRSEGKNNLLAAVTGGIDPNPIEQDRESPGNHKVGVSLTGYAIVKD